MGTGYRPEKNFGSRWVPGTGQKKISGYRWVPGTGQKKIFGYQWVPGTEKIFTYADPCLNLYVSLIDFYEIIWFFFIDFKIDILNEK